MKARNRRISILALIYIGILSICCISGPMHESDAPNRQVPSFLSKKIALSSGEYSINTTELKTAVSAEDLTKLDEFVRLSKVDFSGSTCYEEIIEWSKAHPDIDTSYTVTLPTGASVQNDVETLDMSGLRHESVEKAAAVLPYLTKLKSVELGSAAVGGDLTGSDLGILSAACPAVSYYYAFSVLGKDVTLNDESIDLTGIGQNDAEDVAGLLSCMPKLNTVELGKEEDYSPALSWDVIRSLQDACPNAEFNYSFSLYGQPFTLASESMDLNHIKISDKGAAVRKALSCMPRCTYLDMDYCGVSNEDMAAIREEFPNVDVVWRIWFGNGNYSVRTDTEKIFASKPSVGGMLYDKDVELFKYCTKVRYLDIGHDTEVSTCDFVRYMPDLEVFIIAMTNITDISPLANCSHLEYLEIFSTQIGDLSPLSGLSELRHLNILFMPNVNDISPLFSLTELERLWIGTNTPVPAEQVEQMRAAAPNCDINTWASDPNVIENWRYTRVDWNIPKYYWTPRYELLAQQLGYFTREYSFYWLDPKCGDPAPAEYAGIFGG